MTEKIPSADLKLEEERSWTLPLLEPIKYLEYLAIDDPAPDPNLPEIRRPKPVTE